MAGIQSLMLIGIIAAIAVAGLYAGGFFSKIESIKTEVEKPLLQCILIRNEIDAYGKQQITMLYLNKSTVPANGIESTFSKDGTTQRIYVGIVPPASGISQYIEFSGSGEMIQLPTKFETNLGNSESDSCNRTLAAPKAG
ncbi:MAG: hypothetical protein WC602_04625 [archaeon]